MPAEGRDPESGAVRNGGRDMTTGGSLTGSASVRKLQTVLHAKAKEEPGPALPRPCRQGMAGGLPADGMGRWSGATAERLESMV